jgi:alpha-glucosidase
MYATAEAGTEQLFVTRTTLIANAQLLPSAGTHLLQIKLDTTGAQWMTSAFVDGAQLGTNYAYASNPTIHAAGIGQTTLNSSAGIQWNYWTLSAEPLEITQQPASATVNSGTAFTNPIVVRASPPLFYQWFFNSSSNYGGATALTDSPDGHIDGSGSNSLAITNVHVSDAGYYYVVVTNSVGSVTSAVASLSVLTNVITNPAPSQLASPDGSLVLTFAVSNFDGSLNCPVYSLTRNGQTLITTSKLGLTFGGGLLRENLAVLSQTNSANDSTWRPVYGEKSLIRDNYNQLVANLQEASSPYRLLQLTFRAYNEGLAFCYTIPSHPGLAGATNLTEQTEFRFAADYTTWATYTAQGVYSQTTINGISTGCERPLPVQLATNLYVALGEAGLVDCSRMKFAPLAGKPYCLVSLLDGPVTNSLPLTTPWRFIMAADSPGQLLENNFFVLNLNTPCALTNTAWIKPGKVIRETTLKTVSGMACVDFAAKHTISYIEFDAGWYGPENSTLTATNVAGSALDLPGVINYAASNNIGVILYVNWLAMTNELSLLPPLYHGWGVKGIKYGFVSVGPQPFTEIVNTAARICASNQMMLEVHDEFRPSGYTRTYPNFVTVEGISGDETTPTTAQDTTLLFSRMLDGGADHTVCYFDPRVTNNWSYAYQLAKAVCFYSPWQYLYWYDRPTNSYNYVSGGNDMLTEVPEMEFYDYLPTVWDETRVLQGSIGQYAILARRAGAQWFIGAMNANSTRTFNVPLSFLTSGQKYIENIYSQDPSVPTRTHVRIDRLVVDSTATLTMTLDASRGEAVRLLPADPPEIQSISRLANGGFSLSITGIIGQPFSLWTSSALALPATNWTLLGSGLITNIPLTWNGLHSQSQNFFRCSTP